MVNSPTPDTLYDSAREFAESALEAHHARKYRRVALDAGTALEHLAKACLATRSPALLTELRGEASFPSVLRLLGISQGSGARRLRTVGLRDALDRVKAFVSSAASGDDLRTLIDMRDGTVHAAGDDKVEERLLVAFAQHADELLADLGRDRAQFWGGQLSAVDALLADASDKVAHDVEVQLAAAHASFERQFGEAPDEMLAIVQRLTTPNFRGGDVGDERADCPVCDSHGVATGDTVLNGAARLMRTAARSKRCGSLHKPSHARSAAFGSTRRPRSRRRAWSRAGKSRTKTSSLA
jgi:hypothetical protein